MTYTHTNTYIYIFIHIHIYAWIYINTDIDTYTWIIINKYTCIYISCLFFFYIRFQFNSFQFSRSVVPDCLRPHDSQHARPPCPSPAPGVYSNSCTLSRWCHPAISSSIVPFSSCPQSLPASGSFPVSQLFAEVAKVLELQHQSFQRMPRTDLL